MTSIFSRITITSSIFFSLFFEYCLRIETIYGIVLHWLMLIWGWFFGKFFGVAVWRHVVWFIIGWWCLVIWSIEGVLWRVMVIRRSHIIMKTILIRHLMI